MMNRVRRTSITLLVSHAPFVLSVILIIIKEVCMATVEKQGYFTGWTPKAGGIIAPDERLPWGQSIFLGLQHVLAMFGATVLAPIIMGFNPNTAIFFSGIGTLIFFVIVGGRVPSYLGSSFSFIAVVIAASAYAGKGPNAHIDVALGGIIAAGVLYAIIGLIVIFTGYKWIEYLMPPVVTGAVVAVIGLKLGTPIDFTNLNNAAWIGLPAFTAPSFHTNAMILIAPVAIILVAENLGHVKAVAAMTGRNLDPYLGRAFLGDGVATIVSALGGGTGLTTYAENIGTMAVTRIYSTVIFIIAAVVAILLGFCPKFGALIATIPSGVIGGLAIVLFGLIAATAGRIWVQNGVDFSKARNLITIAVALILGAGNFVLNIGGFALGGIGTAAFGAIIIYQLLREREPQPEEVVPADAAVVEAPGRETEPGAGK